MTDAGTIEVTGLLSDLTTSSLVVAALASALSDERARTPAEALEIDGPRAAVLRTLPDAELALRALWEDRSSRSSNLVSSLSQAAAAAAGTTRAWSDVGDEVMIAQGRSSALMARFMLKDVAPAYGVLAADSSARILDVGTGIGAIATALAEARPGIEVTGIDIAERPLDIARTLVDELHSQVAARISFRQQDVTELGEKACYDVVWMPMPFLPDAIVDRALDRATEALTSGGLLVLGTRPDVAGGGLRAADAWIASLTGGGTLTTSAVADRLSRRGFRRILRFDTVPGAPVLLAAVAPH
ncbi:class I SAM-dependent methyltransferase [Herbiconiux ginsengi]|uniref:Methyltransferase domain-containing protein n=1 Tax=Herbiconiux ginsengi TaxID=381665 RepID=A0A1H3SZY6_9MICO|nr:class I SAM-dependent methyltransferase [Herbiconiux ginsengi]SDZ43340.1 Methyltransferase domain-containing protein [Herbiconiux ginsengi]